MTIDDSTPGVNSYRNHLGQRPRRQETDMTLNTFQQWQVDNGHHVAEQVDGDEVHAPELCPVCTTAERYAAKWRADGHAEKPTDEALGAAFAGCVRPAKPSEYAAIREALR